MANRKRATGHACGFARLETPPRYTVRAMAKTPRKSVKKPASNTPASGGAVKPWEHAKSGEGSAGDPLAARFVFELTTTPDGGGSAIGSTALAIGLATGLVLLVGLGAFLVPVRRILAIEASEAMHAEG